MNRKIKWKGVRRATAALLAGLCLLTSTGATAIRADAADGGKKPATAETAATPETAAPADLSERAQAFIDAVNALDRDGMVSASNAWGLAHEAWLANPDNAELEAALNEATAAQEEACAPLSEAEELYNQISEAERSDERVQDAYAALAVILAATYTAMENPTATGPDGTPELDEIRRALYGDLPDEPTGSYIGSMGLPIATGQTRISISEWVTDLYDGVDAHINAEALHADDLVITVDREPGEEYAIVPLMVQVEYPANGSTSEILLPEDVVLLDFEGNPADTDEIASITKASYTETSASASGFYVKAKQDFSVEFVYHGPDGSELRKTLQVKLGESKVAAKAAANAGASTYAAGPTPPFTTGKITSISFEGGTWLIWFNGQEAYCCSHGLNGQPNGCPTYNFSYVSKLEPGQYTPGNHYANQINIWGGLNQLSLGLLEEKHSDAPATTFGLTEENAAETAYRYYDDTQLWIMEHYPDSLAAQTYRASAQALAEQGTENRAATYSGENGYYTYIYNPPAGYAWQIVAIVGEEIPAESGGEEVPDAPDAEYYSANWSAPPQTASGSFDLTFTINTDKQQLETAEKVDGATITITPSKTGGSIDGGTWTMAPAGAQTVTTSGHTQDDKYQTNGGDATATWTVHYEVTKTSTTSLSGQEGPYASQEEANAAAEAAKNAAISQLQAEAQGMVDAAIAAARAELASIAFQYDEIDVPYGFDEFDGALGSHQTITVPADSSNDYVMKNDEWSLQVNLKKVDSETGEQIAGDALYEVYEWDTATQQYIPYGGYNQYSVVRNPDGTYSVANGSNYGTEYDTSRKMYYTQRNEGKFIIVETRAPSGYYGDWSDVEHPGTAGTPLGKRGYYIEITRTNDGSVITLDNTHYSADIATSYTGGTKLLTSGGVETTVTIYKGSDEPAAEIRYQDAGRAYNTDNSGTAANEDSYTMTPVTGVMQNDRVLGEISLSKVDLDAVRYVGGRDTDGDAMASGQAHADARLDGAVYDLYAAEDIQHPDGVTGTVDYSKITYPDGTPIWHTTIRDNSGQWVDDYLPVLAKDHLVASATIKDGWLTFSNLYLGRYYIVERGTGVVIPVEDGAYKLSGTYPDIDAKTKEPTGTTSLLATNGQGQYTDYVYRHQWSYIGQSKALDGTKTYDGYYESYAKGYLCDEHNYYITPTYADEGWYVEKTAFADNRQAEGEQLDTTDYSANYHLHRDNELAESDDQVMKGNIELSKHVSSTGSSDGIDLEGAGFTFYLISDLSKEDQFAQSRSGKYLLNSILDAYINPDYDESHLKYDFSGEAQAIAKTYEVNTDQIAAYNATLTAAGDFKNGSGDGWVATGRPNEYQLAEIFSNDTGTIRVQGLPYGQYLVVETTIPKDVFQAQPFIVDIDPTDESNPQSAMANPKDAVQTPSDSYQKYTVLNEEIEVYLRVTKIDEETGKPALLKGAAFQIYWMDEQGNHIYDENGHAKLVTMTDTTDPLIPKNVDTFYTDDTGMLVLPEKLPLGHYRLVEVSGPDGFYNEWGASAVYDEDGHLFIDDTGRFADGTFYVDFEASTERAYKATGDDSEDSQDILVIDEDYQNNETLGVLKIRKTGEVLTGWQEDEGGTFDPEFSGEARPGHFVYEERPIPYAEYTITANEDIYTQDRQTDANGNRTLWYAKGDVVAVVRTGDGTSDIAAFAPGRTNSTYDFLSVIHDGAVGEVTVTLPLGSYHVEETGAPYGFVGTSQSYDVTFVWDSQLNDVVMATTITNDPGDGSASQTSTYPIVNVKDATEAEIEAQVLHRQNGWKPLLRDYGVLIIDEAHKLPEVNQQMQTRNLTVADLNAIADQLARENLVHESQQLRRITDELVAAFGTMQHGRAREIPYAPQQEQLATLDRLHHQLCERTQQDGRKLSPPLRRAVQRVIELTQLFLMPNDSSTMYVEYAAELGDSKQIVSLNAVPKDLPQHLYTTLWSRCKPAILTSGTLAAGDGFANTSRLLGLEHGVPVRTLQVSSPFDYVHNCLLVLPSSSGKRKHMETSNEQIAKQLCQLIEAAHGHALALFTSYEQMGAVYELLKVALNIPILQARRGAQAIVEQFKQLPNGVLLAGGSCWEGIDFPGDLVSLLVIVRLPFPVPDPVREARREQYPDLHSYIQTEIVPEMQQKLRQGFGRAIRTETDSCAVAILDPRAAPDGRYHQSALDALPDGIPITTKIEDIEPFLRAHKSLDYFLSNFENH